MGSQQATAPNSSVALWRGGGLCACRCPTCVPPHRPAALPAGDNSFPRVDGFKGSFTYSNSGETWVEVRPFVPPCTIPRTRASWVPLLRWYPARGAAGSACPDHAAQPVAA